MSIPVTSSDEFGDHFVVNTAGMQYSCSVCMRTGVVDKDQSNDMLVHYKCCEHTACNNCLRLWMERGKADCPQCRLASVCIRTVRETLQNYNTEYCLIVTEILDCEKKRDNYHRFKESLDEELAQSKAKLHGMALQYGLLPTEENNMYQMHRASHSIQKVLANSINMTTNMIQQCTSRCDYEDTVLYGYHERQIHLCDMKARLLSNYTPVEEGVEDEMIDDVTIPLCPRLTRTHMWRMMESPRDDVMWFNGVDGDNDAEVPRNPMQ